MDKKTIAENRLWIHNKSWKKINEFEWFYGGKDFMDSIKQINQRNIFDSFLWVNLDVLKSKIENNWFLEDYKNTTKQTWWNIRWSSSSYLKIKKLIKKYYKINKITENEKAFLLNDLEKSQPINKKTKIIKKIEDIKNNVFSMDIFWADKYTKEMLWSKFTDKENIDFSKNFVEIHISNKESRKNNISTIPIKEIIKNIYENLRIENISSWYIYWISFLIKIFWKIKWIPMIIKDIDWDILSKLSLTKKYFFLQSFETHKKIAEKYNPLEDIKLWIMKIEDFIKRYENLNL